MSSEISDLCEISDLLFFVSYFASLSKGIKFGDYLFDVCFVNWNFLVRFQMPISSYSTGINKTSEKYWTQILDFNYFSFCNCNINPNLTHLPKHQILGPNHQSSQHIWYVECCSVHAHMAWSQKFCKWDISLDTDDSASNAVVKRSLLSVFINQRCAEFINQCCAECVFAYYGLRVCGQRYIIIICDRLRKSCTTVE